MLEKKINNSSISFAVALNTERGSSAADTSFHREKAERIILHTMTLLFKPEFRTNKKYPSYRK
jgi:hypothetical protein